MPLYALGERTPVCAPDTWVADNAMLIGSVVLESCASVFFGAVLRGDTDLISIGARSNIQDNAVIHATYKKSPTAIGNNVTIAHQAVVHGCTLHDNVMVGIGAVILDDVVVESNSIIAAGAVVTKGTVIPSGTVWAGVPARKVKDISIDLLEGEVLRIAGAYGKYASWYQ